MCWFMPISRSRDLFVGVVSYVVVYHHELVCISFFFFELCHLDVFINGTCLNAPEVLRVFTYMIRVSDYTVDYAHMWYWEWLWS